MIDMRYKPNHLPQVSAPFLYVVDQLDNEKVKYKILKTTPDELKPTQGLVDLCKVSSILRSGKINQPIWLSRDNDILDGHHRYAASINRNEPLKAIQIDLPLHDAARILNKIVDIFNYKRQRAIDEVVSQDVINAERESDLLDQLLRSVPKKENKINKEVFTGYREDEPKPNSKVGNFFSLNPNKEMKKFEIEFDNLLDTDRMDITFSNESIPTVGLAKIWFPDVDLNEVATEMNSKIENLCNRLVAEKAKKMGYDGIKYGSIMLQVL
jgi:hypothetical protein